MYGLVLEGGGAKGAYHIGAYKALRELGVEINGVAGTSIGALNGAMIVQDKFEKVYDMWYNISPSKVFNIDEKHLEELINFEINQENIVYMLHKAKEILNNRGLDISRVRKLLEDNIDEKLLRNSEMDFGIVTINLSEMRPMELFIEDIPEGKVVNYLLASAYFPAFKLEKMDGSLFIDGGFYDNLPINLLYFRGYRNLIAIRTFGMGRRRKLNEDNINITYITPREDLCRILDFSRDKARKNLKLGYYDTCKAICGLKGDKYYIKSEKDNDYYMHFFLNLGEDKILKIGKLFNIEGIPYRRLLFEFIIPKMATLLNTGENSSYEDIAIAFAERVANRCGIERFEIYRFQDFIAKIKKKYRPGKGKKSFSIPGFVRKNELLSRAVKEELLDEIAAIYFG